MTETKTDEQSKEMNTNSNVQMISEGHVKLKLREKEKFWGGGNN